MVGLLIRTPSISTIDLRDNQWSAHEWSVIVSALAAAACVDTLNLAGCTLVPSDVRDLIEALKAVGKPTTRASTGSGRSGMIGNLVDAADDPRWCSLTELDLSRTSIGTCMNKSLPLQEFDGLGTALRYLGSVRRLSISAASLSDAAAAALVRGLGRSIPMPMPTGPTPVPDQQPLVLLVHLDMSRNMLGQESIRALANALPSLIHLSSLSLAHNNLGAAGGSLALEACLSHRSLCCLDLSAANLTNVSPLYPEPGVRTWSAHFIDTLAEVLSKHNDRTEITELMLNDNELCGVWSERVCGQSTMRGTYCARS